MPSLIHPANRSLRHLTGRHNRCHTSPSHSKSASIVVADDNNERDDLDLRQLLIDASPISLSKARLVIDEISAGDLVAVLRERIRDATGIDQQRDPDPSLQSYLRIAGQLSCQINFYLNKRTWISLNTGSGVQTEH